MSNINNDKRGLENLKQHEPRPDLWDKIEAGLDNDNRPKIIYWRWVTGLAATIAIILTINFIVKKDVNPSIVEVNFKTTAADSANEIAVEINSNKNPILPAEKTLGDMETPTTGPWDGKAGLAMGDPNYRTSEPIQADTLLSGLGTYTYSWDFGADVTATDALPVVSHDAILYTVDVNNVTSSDSWSLAFTTGDVNMNGVLQGSYTIDSDIKTNYQKFDNVGYVDSDGLASNSGKILESYEVNLVESIGEIEYEELKSNQDERITVIDYSRKSLDTKDIQLLPAKEINKLGALSSVGAGRKDLFRKMKTKNFKSSTIEIPPSDRVFQNEKYQVTLTDSVAGYFSKKSVPIIEPRNTESYFPLIENEYLKPTQEPLSTFGIDVDNASYTVMRSKINSNQIVPKDAVRIEEFVNYFDYNYQEPDRNQPFSINLENASCPWNTKHQLVRIGLKGKDINYNELQASNLVFLIDVSGSMDNENKLPLVKKSMKLLVDQMGPNDRIAVVTYAGAAGLALESTRCSKKDFIKKKIDKLDAGGSTAGGEGIKLAYNIALQNLVPNGNNRVIMCTDGDFNVGQSSDNEMKQLIINNRNKGIFITACGFGMGNYQDSKMETIADNGNGNYFYIDTYKESEKVFNREIRATLFTIAKDVKIQVEFNPKHVKAYRLIGYENRKMPPQDFNDDTKDGGELGAGHTVTALYEIISANSDEEIPGNIQLKYQKPENTLTSDFGDEMLTVKLRYKEPNGTTSMLLEKSMGVSSTSFEAASNDFQFASGVALYAQQLRQSKFIDQENFDLARGIVKQSLGSDPNGDRKELLTLIDKASKNYQIYTKE
jgi:Ca-activated chloride channel homolog